MKLIRKLITEIQTQIWLWKGRRIGLQLNLDKWAKPPVAREQLKYKPFSVKQLMDIISSNKIEVESHLTPQGPIEFLVKDQENFDKVMEFIYTECPAMYWGGVQIVEKFKNEESCN